jgi:hypothetical protein
MLYQPRPQASGRLQPVISIIAGNSNDQDKARRFREAALPHLDEVYTVARYLLEFVNRFEAAFRPLRTA